MLYNYSPTKILFAIIDLHKVRGLIKAKFMNTLIVIVK